MDTLSSIQVMPTGPIGGSFAWTVPEVLKRDDWTCRLGTTSRRSMRRCASRGRAGLPSRRSTATASRSAG